MLFVADFLVLYLPMLSLAIYGIEPAGHGLQYRRIELKGNRPK